ncbi:CsbD family protein [Streptomyces sp. NPDC058960]|uniref:CsbD family protein n=1 Tax=Streptomyces sp. NPDC058960 TaxID=3346679 RepID=UPI0036CD470E
MAVGEKAWTKGERAVGKVAQAPKRPAGNEKLVAKGSCGRGCGNTREAKESLAGPR